MPGTVERQGEIDVPIDFAFGFVADYHNVPKWMFGVSEFQPRTDRTHGIGAVFATSFSSGIAALEVELTAVEWRDDEVITLESQQEPAIRARFTFASANTGSTLVRVRIDYPVRPGLAGRVLEKISETIVGQAVRHVETNLRRELISAYRTEHPGAFG